MTENHWECGLSGCSYQFPDDLVIDARKSAHNIWHEKAQVQKRNTIQGKPEWKLVDEFGEELCQECEGEGFVEYQIAVDDTKLMPCEKCNDGDDYYERED